MERSFFAKALAIRHCGMAVMWVKHGKTMSSTTTCLMVYSTHKMVMLGMVYDCFNHIISYVNFALEMHNPWGVICIHNALEMHNPWGVICIHNALEMHNPWGVICIHSSRVFRNGTQAQFAPRQAVQGWPLLLFFLGPMGGLWPF